MNPPPALVDLRAKVSTPLSLSINSNMTIQSAPATFDREPGNYRNHGGPKGSQLSRLPWRRVHGDEDFALLSARAKSLRPCRSSDMLPLHTPVDQPHVRMLRSPFSSGQRKPCGSRRGSSKTGVLAAENATGGGVPPRQSAFDTSPPLEPEELPAMPRNGLGAREASQTTPTEGPRVASAENQAVPCQKDSSQPLRDHPSGDMPLDFNNAGSTLPADFQDKLRLNPNYYIPKSAAGPEYFADAPQDGHCTLLVIMMGLPARGKTFLAQKISRLLGWHSYTAQTFNVQVAWRNRLKQIKSTSPKPGRPFTSSPPASKMAEMSIMSADVMKALLTDPDSEARFLYREVLDEYIPQATKFFSTGGEVLIINDDFPTAALRAEAESRFASLAQHTVYIEVSRDSEQNKEFDRLKVQDANEYPVGTLELDAAQDFAARLAHMEAAYETILPSSNTPYIKVQNTEFLEVHQVHDSLSSRIVSFLMNLTQFKVQHPIYFIRHGRGEFNVNGMIGGDAPLTDLGREEALLISDFIADVASDLEYRQQKHRPPEMQATPPPLSNSFAPSPAPTGDGSTTPRSMPTPSASHPSTEWSLQHESTSVPGACSWTPPTRDSAKNVPQVEIWTSQLKRAVETAEVAQKALGLKVLKWASLNELHAGVCESMTLQEVKEKFPLIYRFREENKYTFRYPEGESYQDLVQRLEPVILDLENASKTVVVITHQAALRCLLAYFGGFSAEDCVRVKVPHTTAWRCTYDPKGLSSLHYLRLNDVYRKESNTRRTLLENGSS